MSETEVEDSENNAEREGDITTSLETEDIVEKKGNTTSIVWTWFGYGKSDHEQAKPICKICRRLVPARTGNTTNLFHHLRRHHPSNYSESVTLRAQAGTTPHTQPSKTTTSPVSIASGSSSFKQQSIQSCFAAIAPYEKKTKRSKNITSAKIIASLKI